jgi:glycosyltransferase involved in cell wall biosynthesis
MTSDSASVSVIIPAFNAAIFLRDAIESVLAEPHRPLEIIVVDDGSTDKTADIARSFGDAVTCLCQPNAGPAAARNRGLKAAKGDYIAFLDADDLWVAGRLACHFACLASHPEAEIAFGTSIMERLVSAPGAPMVFEPAGPWSPLEIQLGRCLYRRRLFARIGAFDPALRYAEDWDLFARIREQGVAVCHHSDVVQRVRRHGHNMTSDGELTTRYRLLMVKRSLDRRRQAAGGDARPMTRSDPVIPAGAGGRKEGE